MRRALVVLTFVACTKGETGTGTGTGTGMDARVDAGGGAGPGEFVLRLVPPGGDPTVYTVRGDGVMLVGPNPRQLGKPTTVSVIALADEAVDACAEAGGGSRAQLMVTHGTRTVSVAHDVEDDACTRALSRLERRLVGLR